MILRAIRPKKKAKPRRGGRQVSIPVEKKDVSTASIKVAIEADAVTEEEDKDFIEKTRQKVLEAAIEEPKTPEAIKDILEVFPEKPKVEAEVLEVDDEMGKECYLVIDFEATCFRGKKVPQDEREIIEFAAAIVEKKTMSIEGEFSMFVKPVVHPELHEYCKELTSISQEDVDQAFTFPTVLRQFQSWMNGFEGKKIFSSWGDYDKDQLKIDCHRHGVSFPFGEDHVNLKILFSDIKGYKRNYGLSSALKRVKLSFEGTRHRGIDDVRNIIRVMKKVL